jgi:simple sugar transport system permease protein
MFNGAFGTPRRIWNLLNGTAILLGISLALTPAFRMKFWNCGGEGQTMIGALATTACMFYFGESLPLPVLFIVIFVTSLLAGAIWAVIPSLFKAFFGTNETLFTLMMNYMATQVVKFALKKWVTDGTTTLPTMVEYRFPKLFGKDYLLTVILVLLVCALLYVYLRYSKQGYEISVVGESENTAKYIGISVKKVIIRTMIISGAICGFVGMLLVANGACTITTDLVGGRGFTAILVSWLAKFNPLIMILTSFLVAFLDAGAGQISTDFRMDTSICDILTAIILFFIIGCEFFIQYKINFRKSHKEEQA